MKRLLLICVGCLRLGAQPGDRSSRHRRDRRFIGRSEASTRRRGQFLAGPGEYAGSSFRGMLGAVVPGEDRFDDRIGDRGNRRSAGSGDFRLVGDRQSCFFRSRACSRAGTTTYWSRSTGSSTAKFFPCVLNEIAVRKDSDGIDHSSGRFRGRFHPRGFRRRCCFYRKASSSRPGMKSYSGKATAKFDLN